MLLVTNANSDETRNEELDSLDNNECSPQGDLQDALDPVCCDTAPTDDDSAALHGLALSPDDEVLAGWLRALESLSPGSGVNRV